MLGETFSGGVYLLLDLVCAWCFSDSLQLRFYVGEMIEEYRLCFFIGRLKKKSVSKRSHIRVDEGGRNMIFLEMSPLTLFVST